MESIPTPVLYGLIAFLALITLMILAHLFLPFQLFPKEDPLDQRIAHDLPETPDPDDATIAEVMRTGQPVIRNT